MRNGSQFEPKREGLDQSEMIEYADASHKRSIKNANMRNETVVGGTSAPSSADSTTRAGFTIIESIMAVSVLSITMGAFIMLSLCSLRELALASDYFRATALARNRVERVRTMNFDTILGLTEAEHRVDGHGNPSPEGVYLRETVVSSVTENCANILVTVSFPGRLGHPQAKPVVIETLHTRGL